MSLLKSLAQGVTTAFADAWNGIQHLWSNDAEPLIKETVALLDRNGGTVLLKIVMDAGPDLLAMQFGAAVVAVLADLKAAGVQTIAEEEQLAAATAIQIAKNAAAALMAAGTAPAAPPVTPPATETPAPAETAPPEPPAGEPATTPPAEPETPPSDAPGEPAAAPDAATGA